MNCLPRHLRLTKAERRRKRAYLQRDPWMAGLYGILWSYRVIMLKRRRRWAKRGEQRHERHMRATTGATGTIGGRSRAYDVLNFNEDEPRMGAQLELDKLFWRDSFLITLPPDAIITPNPSILMHDHIFDDLDKLR